MNIVEELGSLAGKIDLTAVVEANLHNYAQILGSVADGEKREGSFKYTRKGDRTHDIRMLESTGLIERVQTDRVRLDDEFKLTAEGRKIYDELKEKEYYQLTM